MSKILVVLSVLNQFILSSPIFAADLSTHDGTITDSSHWVKLYPIRRVERENTKPVGWLITGTVLESNFSAVGETTVFFVGNSCGQTARDALATGQKLYISWSEGQSGCSRALLDSP